MIADACPVPWMRFGLRNAVGAALVRLALLVVKGESHRGYDVMSIGSAGDRDILIQRLDAGLDLIQHFDPRRFSGIQRHLHRFVFVPGGGDHYSPVLQAHMMDASRLRNATNTLTALSIIHEATHGRLHRRGIATCQANAERIERLCVGEQIAFAKRLPGGETIARQLSETLKQPWWGEAKTQKRILTRLELAGWPKWLIWLVTLPERLRGKHLEL